MNELRSLYPAPAVAVGHSCGLQCRQAVIQMQFDAYP